MKYYNETGDGDSTNISRERTTDFDFDRATSTLPARMVYQADREN